ncbi:MAG: hypothetical protein ABIT47_03415 [Candidatus Paceibacterota bacterium]
MIDYFKRCEEVQAAKNIVIATVMPELRKLSTTKKGAFDIAAREIRAALDHGGFSAHVAEDSVVWKILHDPVLTQVEYELERDYILSTLLGPIMAIIADVYDTHYCQKMLEARIQTSA